MRDNKAIADEIAALRAIKMTLPHSGHVALCEVEIEVLAQRMMHGEVYNCWGGQHERLSAALGAFHWMVGEQTTTPSKIWLELGK